MTQDEFPGPPAGRAARSGRRPPSEPVRWTLPGFCENSRISTSFGDLPIQALRRRDPLRTAEGTLATVERVDRVMLDEEFLGANPDALPVRIPAGAIGHGRPKSDLLVSPHQMLNVSASQFGRDFRLARDLTDRPGIMRSPVSMVVYYMFRCTAPASVLVEGVTVQAASG